MFSGKSQDLIKVATNYDFKNTNYEIIYPSEDSRGEYGKIESRLGSGLSAKPIYGIEGLNELLNFCKEDDVKVILVDEVQFMSEEQIDALRNATIDFSVTVICWGLKNDYMSKLFPGSKRLLEVADKIEEIKTECQYCSRKATQSLMVNSKGEQVLSGEQTVIGSDEFTQVCFKHYRDGK